MSRKLISRVRLVLNIALMACVGLWLYRVATGWSELRWDVPMIAVAFMTALIVNGIKMARLYILFCGKHVKTDAYVRKYMTTSLINMIVPFKAGEIWRGIIFGKMAGSYISSFVIVLFDRFIDTTALLALVVMVCLYTGMPMTMMYAALTVFVMVAVVLYLNFFSLYRYWNRVLILRANTKSTLMALTALDTLKKVIWEVRQTSSGKFMMLFMVSVVAWSVEILAAGFFGYALTGRGVNAYLNTVLTGGIGAYTFLYFITSVCIYAGVYGVLQLVKRRK